MMSDCMKESRCWGATANDARTYYFPEPKWQVQPPSCEDTDQGSTSSTSLR